MIDFIPLFEIRIERMDAQRKAKLRLYDYNYAPDLETTFELVMLEMENAEVTQDCNNHFGI